MTDKGGGDTPVSNPEGSGENGTKPISPCRIPLSRGSSMSPPPESPKFVQAPRAEELPPLEPDSEKNVLDDSSFVFRQIVERQHSQQLQESGIDADELVLPQIPRHELDQHRAAVVIGQQLAVIGDDINRRYGRHFDEMVRWLNLCCMPTQRSAQLEQAYEIFAGVARSLFQDGRIHWGRIISLFCFTSRLAIDIISRGMSSFYRQVISFLIRFLASERIARWIADQGGWVAVLRYAPESISWNTLGVFIGGALLTVVLTWFFNKPS